MSNELSSVEVNIIFFDSVWDKPFCKDISKNCWFNAPSIVSIVLYLSNRKPMDARNEASERVTDRFRKEPVGMTTQQRTIGLNESTTSFQERFIKGDYPSFLFEMLLVKEWCVSVVSGMNKKTDSAICFVICEHGIITT